MQPVGLVEGAEDGLCYFHAKKKAGLIEHLMSGRRTVSSSDLLSDEQLEVAQALRALGAPEGVVSQAIQKDLRVRIGARKGARLKAGRPATP